MSKTTREAIFALGVLQASQPVTHILADPDGRAVQEAAVEIHVAAWAHGDVVSLPPHGSC